MHSVLVAIKESQKRGQIVAALRTARPECVIRQTDTLEDIMSLVRVTLPDVLITTLDQQRHETLHLLDDLQLSAPQVSVVVVLGLADFELLSHAVRAGGADYLLYPFKDNDLARLLSSIEEREEALFETSMFTGILSRREKTPAQKAGEEALRAFVAGKAYDLSALQGEENESPYLAVVHGEGTHELLAAYLSGARLLFDAPVTDCSGVFLIYPRPEQGGRWLRTQLLSALSHARHGDYSAPDIGVSAPMDELETDLPTALTQARTALSFQFYEPNGSLTLYEDLVRELTRDASISAVDEDSLIRSIDEHDTPAIREGVRRVFMHLAWPRSRPALVLRTLYRLCARLQAHGVDTAQLESSLEQNLRLKELEAVFERTLSGE